VFVPFVLLLHAVASWAIDQLTYLTVCQESGIN